MFAGSIPTEIGNLDNLQDQIMLSSNRLQGPVTPCPIFYSNMRYLALSRPNSDTACETQQTDGHLQTVHQSTYRYKKIPKSSAMFNPFHTTPSRSPPYSNGCIDEARILLRDKQQHAARSSLMRIIELPHFLFLTKLFCRSYSHPNGTAHGLNVVFNVKHESIYWSITHVLAFILCFDILTSK